MTYRTRAWYANLPLRFKIMAWLVPVLLASVAITGAFSYYVAANLSIEKIRQGQIAIANQAVTQIGYMDQTLTDTYDYLYLNPQLHQVIDDRPVSSGTQLSVFTMIDDLMVTREYLGSLIIYSNRVAPIASQNGSSAVMAYDQFLKYGYSQEAITNPSSPVYTYVSPTQSPFLNSKRNQVLFVHAYQSLRTLGVEGVVVIGIAPGDLQRMVGVPSNSQLQVFLISREGRVITDTHSQWLGQPVSTVPLFREAQRNTGSWVLASASSPLNGWKVVVAQSKADMLAQLKRIRWLTAVFAGAVFCIGLMLSYWAAFSITSPLRRMLLAMEQVQSGDFETQVETRSRDEIGQLGDAFNTMVRRIRSLIHDMYYVRLRQREAEVRLLQSQMNPHFLYNTLNLIAWTAQSRNDLEIADMIYSLSNVFRTSLSDGRDFITLREEFGLVENYLKLQRFRLPDRLEYQTTLPEEFAEIVIPKLTIQPFVENAIVHGLEGSQEKTFLEVSVRAVDHGLCIEIRDNGLGMSPLRLAEIHRRLSAPASLHQDSDSTARARPGFAFANVLERLRGRFGPSVQLAVDSTEAVGTSVTMTIPLKFAVMEG